jgi:hypothetical protein
MDAIAYNKQLDASLAEGGEVNQELFFKFADAHGYGAVSTVGWLEAKLTVLRGRLAKGHALSLYDPATKKLHPVSNMAEFSAWASSNFPGTEV